MSENKGYRFKLEYTERIPLLIRDDKDKDMDSKDDGFVRFTTFGDTPEDTIKGHNELLNEWDRMLDKEVKDYGDKRRYR